MSYADEVFISNCKDILENGVWDTDREVRTRWEDGSPAHTIKKFGVVNRYDLQKEFPIMTLRRQYFKSAVDELLWIWQKKSNNVRDLGSRVWDAWADENGSIGKAYGYQIGQRYRHHKFGMEGRTMREIWDYIERMQKRYPSFSVEPHSYEWVWMNQIDAVLYDLKNNPTSRRILTNIYNFKDLSDMALYPCAYSMTFNVSGDTLNAILNQRSQDMLTANGWNVMQYAALLWMVAQVSGFKAGELVHVIADCHIYDRHVPMVEELIAGKTFEAPSVRLDPTVSDFYKFTKDSFTIDSYQYGDFNKPIPVAV